VIQRLEVQILDCISQRVDGQIKVKIKFGLVPLQDACAQKTRL
jgi:hypothetical protein